MNVSDTDLAWAAGFFEGEGTVQISAKPSSKCIAALSIQVSQVDPEPLAWMQERWPGGFHAFKPNRSGGQNARPFYRWYRTASGAAAFLEQIRPFVVRRQIQERIDVALAFQDQKTRGPFNRTREYRFVQLAFVKKMKTLNRRGAQEALSS